MITTASSAPLTAGPAGRTQHPPQPGAPRRGPALPSCPKASGKPLLAGSPAPTPAPAGRERPASLWQPEACPPQAGRTPGPKGIARLAALSPKEADGKTVEYFRLPVRSVLNPVASQRVGFKWSINPYRGCEFGCQYCYARYTHEFMELDAREFERKIYVKDDVARLLRRELAAGKVLGEHIAIGAATDPYQPAERRFGLTRTVLATLLEFAESLPGPGAFDLSITTKSNLVLKDVDLLRALGRYCRVHVNVSVTTMSLRLARRLEPRAPRPDLRLDTVRRLNYSGVPAGVFVAPILPGITDDAAALEALVAAAAEARAAWLIANVVFLMPSAQKKFFPFIDEKFPRLRKQYRKWFRQSGYAPRAYREHISRRMSELRARYNLPGRWPDSLALRPNVAAVPAFGVPDSGVPDYSALAAARNQLPLPFAS
jgi:DNA repair photolyase